MVAVGGKHKHVVGYMKDFLFGPEQARTPLRVLSGGERGRLMLARALAKPSNVLVLDEPTNDLDLETLDVLEEMLSDYAGTVILISHDRDFLDRIVHAVIVPEGEGRWAEYVGGYSEMLAQRGADLAGKRTAKTKTAAVSKAAAESPAAKRRLSFKDKHALETLPKQMAKLHDEARKLADALADPGLYARDAKAFAEKSERLAALQDELGAAEEKWLELEILREEIESA
jgi:ATP-binding cassette subfamily F protein uup